MRRMEVRCCCNPDKLLGWLPLPVAQPRPGLRVTFLVGGPGHWRLEPDGSVVHVRAETITLEISWLLRPNDSGVLALKSNDTPIETLRRTHGFEENVNG